MTNRTATTIAVATALLPPLAVVLGVAVVCALGR